ncbi:MAG: hypothetical protein AAB355_00375 [Patescibacteria group bacterium]
MEFAKNISGKDLHHAFLVEGPYEENLNKLIIFLRDEIGVKTQGNPDVVIQKFSTLSIDDARALRELATRKSYGGGLPAAPGRAAQAGKKIFIIGADFITHEAGNAMLKLFEEPVSGTHFFLIVPEKERIIPTLRSRLFEIRPSAAPVESPFRKDAKRLLSLRPGERINDALIKDIIEEKDKMRAIILIDELSALLHGSVGVGEETASVFSELLTLRGYLSDRAPSVKLILEEAMLILPSA